MEKDVLIRLHDAINQVLSPNVQGSDLRAALDEVNSITSSELTFEDLSKLRLNSCEWARINRLIGDVHKMRRSVSHKVLKDVGIEDVLIRIKTNIEKIIKA